MKRILLLLIVVTSLVVTACSSSSSVPSVADLSTCTTSGVAAQSTDAGIEALRQAMLAFRNSLSEELRTEASNCLDSERFYIWHNTPANSENRDGITYGDLSDEQLALFQALLQGFLSDDGYQKVDTITFKAEGYLGTLQKVWNPDYYSIDMFGDPEKTGSWGFQLDGHHAAINFLVHGDTVSIVPAFLGSEPAIGSHEGSAFDTFSAERDVALTLYNALTTEENAAAVSTYDSQSLLVGPPDRNGDTDPYIGDYDYTGFETGLQYADMSETTQANLITLMKVYVYNMGTPFADVWWQRVMDNIDDTYFVWLDDVDAPTATSQFYYRIYNPALWIEYNVENVTGGSSNSGGEGHAHSITRIPSAVHGGDYGIFANAVNGNGPRTLLEHYTMVAHHALSTIHFDYALATLPADEHPHDH